MNMNNQIGSLSPDFKTFFSRNEKELSSVEGNLMSVAKGKDIKTIFITSCYPSEGKTVSAVSMAYSLATISNSRVLLIDGNLHAPKIHELFHINQTPGLADLLLANTEANGLIRKTEYDSLSVMPCGTDLFNKLDAFETEMLKEKLAALSQVYNFIIVDGSSVLGSSETTMIANKFDGVVFVVECEKTKWEVLQQAKDRIVGVGGNVLGVILNRRKYYIPQKLYAKV